MAASGTTTYQYDTKDELTREQSARSGGYTNQFGYDAAFNPTSFKGQTNSFNANNQNTQNTFDERGNPTTYRGVSVTWDAENRLTQYGGLLTAGYLPDSLRAWKQDSSGNRTYFLYSGGEPIIEMGSGGTITAVNTFGPTGLLSRHSATGSTFYTFDAQGSVAQRLDSSGNILNSSAYDAFGNKVLTDSSTDPWGYNAQSGYYTDVETGLILCTHRYYDPTQGRWLNRDPIGYAGGVNLYGYVGNGVVDGVDPSGYDWKASLGGAGVGLGFIALSVCSGGTFDVALLAAGGIAAYMSGNSFSRMEGNNADTANADGMDAVFNTISFGADAAMACGMMGGGGGGAGGGGGGGGRAILPDEEVVVRGGVDSPAPVGDQLCGAHGPTLEDAAKGVPHGTIWHTTAGKLRANGGWATHTPEFNENTNRINQRHCDFKEGSSNTIFEGPMPNPIPRKQREP